MSIAFVNTINEEGTMNPALNKFEHYLKINSLKMTNQRYLVAQAFLKHKGHISAEDLYRIVQKKFPQIGFTTVYRTLNLLVEVGLASPNSFKGSFTRFEPADTQEHHDHLICTACGKIIEFKNDHIEELQDEVASQNGFRITEHTLEIFGLCDNCG
ncbi:MAG: transcriptional repressor [Desulfobulbaceae bacterium]|nr:transcriptional repressor [Desulfobulbaceae bacterium]